MTLNACSLEFNIVNAFLNSLHLRNATTLHKMQMKIHNSYINFYIKNCFVFYLTDSHIFN